MGKKGPLTMVGPDEFRSRTSLTFSSRSGTTLEVDAAYDEYYKLRSEANGDKLHAALTRYLKAHSGYWANCERDKVSGGLLEWLWKFTAPRDLAPIAPGSAADYDQRAQKRINEYEIPHSRFGVLYLLGNIDIDLNILQLSVEGVSAVGGAIGSGFATDTSKLGDIKSSKAAFTVPASTIHIPKVMTANLPQVNVTAQQLTSVGQLATGLGGKKLVEKYSHGGNLAVTGKNTHMNDSTSVSTLMPPPPPPKPETFPCTLAALQLAADRIPDVYQHNRFYGVAAGVGAAIVSPVVLAGTLVADGAVNLYRAGQALWEKIKGLLIQFKDWVMSKIVISTNWATLGTIVKGALKFLLEELMKQAAPFVGAAMEIGTGIARTFEAAKTRLGAYLDRKKIRIVPGHPEELANSIETCMTHGILLGLADILKGVAKTAIAATLPGLGSLVAAVLTGVEWLIKLIYRVAEILRVKDFLALARQKWEAEKARAKTVSTDTLIEKGRRTETVNLRNAQTGQVSKSVSLSMGTQSVQVTVDKPTGIFEPNMTQGSFITDTAAFTEFYRKGCDASPLIAMLTLNSGICGSLMTLARMFDDTGEMIKVAAHGSKSKEQFDIAGQYFRRLKEYGAKYLKNSGFRFSPRDAGNKYLEGLLMHAVEHHNPKAATGKAIMAVLSA